MLVGAGVMFGLRQGLDTSLYLAIPAGVLAYAAVLVGVTAALGPRRASGK